MGAGKGGPGLLDSSRLEELRTILEELGLDGWLLADFHHQNPVAASVLGVSGPTRRHFVLLPRRGEPLALVHSIDRGLWEAWPWAVVEYRGWKELAPRLSELLEGRRFAMEFSPEGNLPALDRVPAGTVELLRGLGIEPVTSADLVTQVHARWSGEQLQAHRETAEVAARVAREAFERAARAVGRGAPVREGALAEWILARLTELGLSVDTGCVVAAGPSASDPHYAPRGGGNPIGEGSLLLIDLWGKPSSEDVPADQTWMGYLGASLPRRTREVWEAVRDAREEALDFLRRRWNEGREVRGFEVDDVCRSLLEERGFGRYFLHRTGHSMDRQLHGSGPNLDNVETHDDRRLVPGVGFSVEPGVYIPGELGIRSEVNVHWGAQGPEVTTPHPQDQVFLLLEE